MGSYSISIESPYDTKSYDDIKNNFLWVKNIFETLDLPQLEIDTNFLYMVGEITCESCSFDEFCETAFGQNIVLNRISISVKSNNKQIAYFTVTKKIYNKKNIDLMCSTKKELDDLLTIINNFKIKNESADPSQAVVNNYFGDNIEIKDNAQITNSNIGGENNKVVTEVTGEKETKKEKGFWSSVCQNITSNFIWWVIGAIIISIIGIVVRVKGDDILKLILGR